jgi:hypothetical protein
MNCISFVFLAQFKMSALSGSSKLSDVHTVRPHFLLVMHLGGRGRQAGVPDLPRKHSGTVETRAHHELQSKVLQTFTKLKYK